MFTDKNECEEWGHCDQQCKNTDGSFKCMCVEGFQLEGGTRCRAIVRSGKHHEMMLYFTFHDKILKVVQWALEIYFYNVMKSVVCSIHMYISVFTLLMLIFLKFVGKKNLSK